MSIRNTDTKDPVIKETTIKIIMDVNAANQKSVEFTSSLLKPESAKTVGFSNYPYFSSDINYPSSIKSLPYQEQLDFFFKKDIFLKKLKETTEYIEEKTKYDKKIKEEEDKYKNCLKIKLNNRKAECTDYDESDEVLKTKKEEEKESQIKKNKICRKNIMMMLTLIFPTKYYNTTYNTYEDIFEDSIASAFSFSGIIPIVMNIFLGMKDKSEKYSYLNIPGKGICTITQIVWINDIYNHSEYKKLITKYNEYNLWAIKEEYIKKKELKKEFTDFKTKNSNLLNKLKQLNDDKNLINEIKNNNNRFSSRNDITRQTNIVPRLDIIIDRLFNTNQYIKIKLFINSWEYLNSTTREIIEKHLNEENAIQTNSNYYRIDSKFISELDNLMKLFEIIEFLKEPHIVDKNKVKNESTSRMKEYNEKQRRLTSWNGYNKVNEFLIAVNSIKTQNSSNIYLKYELDKYISGKDNKIEELMNPEDSKKNILYVDTGVSLIDSNSVTIELRVDVIGGKVDDKNKSKVSCIFNGENLGNQLTTLLKPKKKWWELDKFRFFFDINSETASIINENKQIINTTKTQHIKEAISDKSLDKQPTVDTTDNNKTMKQQGGRKKRRNKTVRIK